MYLTASNREVQLAESVLELRNAELGKLRYARLGIVVVGTDRIETLI